MMLTLAPYVIFGALAGTAYLGALWLTVARLNRMRRPLLVFGASAVMRIAIILGVFGWVASLGWDKLFAALGGFVLLRIAAIASLQATTMPERSPRRNRRWSSIPTK